MPRSPAARACSGGHSLRPCRMRTVLGRGIAHPRCGVCGWRTIRELAAAVLKAPYPRSQKDKTYEQCIHSATQCAPIFVQHNDRPRPVMSICNANAHFSANGTTRFFSRAFDACPIGGVGLDAATLDDVIRAQHINKPHIELEIRTFETKRVTLDSCTCCAHCSMVPPPPATTPDGPSEAERGRH